MSCLCCEHDVCLSVCIVDRLQSHNATKSGDRGMIESFGVLSTCMPKSTRSVSILAVIYPGYEKCGLLHLGGIGLTARMSR